MCIRDRRKGKRCLKFIDVIGVLLFGGQLASVEKEKLPVGFLRRLQCLPLRDNIGPAAKARPHLAHVNAEGRRVLQIDVKGGVFALHRADKILHKKIVKFLLLRGRRRRRGLHGTSAGGKGKRNGGGQHGGSRLFQMFHKMSLLKFLIKGAQPAPVCKTRCGLRCFHCNSRGGESHSFSDGFRQKVGGKLSRLFKSILLPVAHCPKNRYNKTYLWATE